MLIISNKKISQKQEKSFNKKVNAKNVAGSGSTPFLKGDGIGNNFFFEMKTNATPRKTITMKKEWFDKAERQAFETGKHNYAVVFSFGELDPITKDHINYVAIDEDLFVAMYKSYEAVKGIVEDLNGLDCKITDNQIRRDLKLFLKRHIKEEI